MAARGWYFAWLATETEAFDPVAHHRRDIGIRSVTVREEEGVDATTCSIVTERMASASLAGKRWAMLSYELPDNTLVPVCRMRRRPVAASESIGEFSLEFDALPSDWQTLRDAGLEDLRVLPYFDPILVAPNRQSDPVEILDGHRRVGHFDRTSGAYSTPELLGVGLPSRTFRPGGLVGWKNGGGVKVRRTKTPLAGVQVVITCDWTEADDGYVDLTSPLKSAFPEGSVGDPTSNGPSSSSTTKKDVRYGGIVPSGVVSTCTPDDLIRSFPKQGANLGGASGYTVIGSSLVKTPTPQGAPDKTGATRRQKARYNYVDDSDVAKPQNLGLDITYFEVMLALSYSLRQRRQERLSYYVPNGNVAYADGAVETLTLRCEDPTVDNATLPWIPRENVAAGEERRFG